MYCGNLLHYKRLYLTPMMHINRLSGICPFLLSLLFGLSSCLSEGPVTERSAAEAFAERLIADLKSEDEQAIASLIYFPEIKKRTFLSHEDQKTFDHHINRELIASQQMTIIRLMRNAVMRDGVLQCTRIYPDEQGVYHIVISVQTLASGINIYDMELTMVNGDALIADIYNYNVGATMSNFFREQILLQSRDAEEFQSAYFKMGMAYEYTKTSQWQEAVKLMDEIPLKYRSTFPDFMGVEAVAILQAPPAESFRLLGQRMDDPNRKRFFAFQAMLYYLESGYFNYALPMLEELREHAGADNIMLDGLEASLHLADGNYGRVHDIASKWARSDQLSFQLKMKVAYAYVMEGKAAESLEWMVDVNRQYGGRVDAQATIDEFWEVSDSVTFARKSVADSLHASVEGQ